MKYNLLQKVDACKLKTKGLCFQGNVKGYIVQKHRVRG